MTPAEIVVQAQGLTRRFGARLAVDGADLALRRGEITCLLGPSGCGKSTLLRMIAGLERPDDGRILVDGVEVCGPSVMTPPERRGIGLVFQDYALFPHLNVLQNVAFGLKGRPRREQRARALDMLGEVRLADRAQSFPHMLSGGEQQRVALARVLAREPRAVLLDEPFSGLDAHLKGEVRENLLGALRTAGAAVLIVTHDADEALRMADALALMDQGRIIQTGAPGHCYRRPASLQAARLLGEINLLPAVVSGGAAETPLGRLSAGEAPEGAARLLFRPEALGWAAQGPQATVSGVSFAGAFHEVSLDLDGHLLRLRETGTPPAPGERRAVALDPDAAWLIRA